MTKPHISRSRSAAVKDPIFQALWNLIRDDTKYAAFVEEMFNEDGGGNVETLEEYTIDAIDTAIEHLKAAPQDADSMSGIMLSETIDAIKNILTGGASVRAVASGSPGLDMQRIKDDARQYLSDLAHIANYTEQAAKDASQSTELGNKQARDGMRRVVSILKKWYVDIESAG